MRRRFGKMDVTVSVHHGLDVNGHYGLDIDQKLTLTIKGKAGRVPYSEAMLQLSGLLG